MWRSLALWTGLALAAGSVGLWVASLWGISWRPSAALGEMTIALWDGKLWATTGGSYFPPGLAAIHSWPPSDSFARLRWWPDHAWFDSAWASGRLTWWTLEMPFWVPSAIGASLAAGVFPAWRRQRRRQREGRCPKCRYDIRGLSTTCPECGGPISPSPTPSPP